MTDQQEIRDNLKKRFMEIVRDMADNVQRDEKQLFVIGATADMACTNAKTKGWRDLKSRMNEQDFNFLLKFFQDAGNKYHQEGDTQRKYACEIMAVSLIARNMHDMHAMAKGDDLLDKMIEDSIKFYQENLWRYKPTKKAVN